MELQFFCSATIKDIIKGHSIENTYNFFVAYPIILSQDTTQLNFFDDLFNNGKLEINSTFTVRNVNEIMNNYNMFNDMFFYRGKIKYLHIN